MGYVQVPVVTIICAKLHVRVRLLVLFSGFHTVTASKGRGLGDDVYYTCRVFVYVHVHVALSPGSPSFSMGMGLGTRLCTGVAH